MKPEYLQYLGLLIGGVLAGMFARRNPKTGEDETNSGIPESALEIQAKLIRDFNNDLSEAKAANVKLQESYEKVQKMLEDVQEQYKSLQTSFQNLSDQNIQLLEENKKLAEQVSELKKEVSK